MLAVTIIYVSRNYAAHEQQIFGYLLAIAAFWYLLFGVIEALPLMQLLPQMIAGAVFLTLAILGLRGSLMLLGIGWLLHCAWDMASLLYTDVSYAPDFTAPLCLGFDILSGIYLIARARGHYPISAAQA